VKKAFSLCFFVISMIVLASIFMTQSPTGEITPTLSEKSTQVSSQQEAPRPKTGLSQKFLNSQLPLEERLEAWTELHKQSPLHPESLEEIASAANPFEGKILKADSVEEREYQREESFRIMALQSLERVVLEDPASMSFIDRISVQASSPVVRSIAKKMKEFAKKGHSYSDLFEQAVMDLEIPQ
jgi:DNA primase